MNRIKSLTKAFFILLASTLFTGALAVISKPATAETTFYVSTTGNDNWSGRLSVSNASHTDGPFATLHRARDAIRALRKEGRRDKFTVLVRGGTYYLKTPLVLKTIDSGAEDTPLLIRSYGNEKPVIRGSRPVSGWKLWQGNIYSSKLTDLPSEALDFHQLFLAGNRLTLARYPNLMSGTGFNSSFLHVENPSEPGSKDSFFYSKGAIPHWPDIKQAEIFIFPGHDWGNSIVSVKNIDYLARKIVLTSNTSRPIQAGNRFFVQNILTALDSPGEWYFDRNTHVLFLWPPPDTSLNDVHIPITNSVIAILEGTHDIQIEGLTIEACKTSAISVNRANRIVIAANRIHNSGAMGIKMRDSSNCWIIGNEITYTGDTGILVSGGDPDKLSPGSIRVVNNQIHDTGVYVKGGAALICRGVGNLIAHNLIHTIPRIGIWFDGYNHRIEYNEIHNVNLETNDSGIIYTSPHDWTKRGTIIKYNKLYNSGGYCTNDHGELDQEECSTYGIYLDDWASGTMVYGNIIMNTVAGAVLIHGGRDNLIKNNIVINGGRQQIFFSAWTTDHPTAQYWLPIMFEKISSNRIMVERYPELSQITNPEEGALMSGNRFVRNIVIYHSADEYLLGILNNVDLNTTVSDYNVFFNHGLPMKILYRPFNRQVFDFGAWQGLGFDKHSTVNDPGLKDIEGSDFSLDPDSPALSLGFVPIPFGYMGRFKSPLSFDSNSLPPDMGIFLQNPRPPVNIQSY